MRMLLLAAFAVSLVTPSDQSELIFLRQRVAELEAKAAAFESGSPLAHGAEQHARSLMFAGGGGSGQVAEFPSPSPPALSADEPEEPKPAAHHASHTIFKMPDGFDRGFMMWMLVLLVIVTIGFEKASEKLEHAAGHHNIKRELLDKMHSNRREHRHKLLCEHCGHRRGAKVRTSSLEPSYSSPP